MTRDKIRSIRLVGIFFISLVLFNYPFLLLFDRPVLVFGIPIMFLYLFGSWMFIIFLTFLVSQSKPSIRSSEHDE